MISSSISETKLSFSGGRFSSVELSVVVSASLIFRVKGVVDVVVVILPGMSLNG
jgi:hypothetical protein